MWRFFKKLKIELPYDPAISLQGIQPVNLREIRISLGNPEEILRIPEESYAPLSVGFCRKEYWSGLPFSPLGGLPNPGIEIAFPELHMDSLPAEPSKNVSDAIKSIAKDAIKVYTRGWLPNLGS